MQRNERGVAVAVAVAICGPCPETTNLRRNQLQKSSNIINIINDAAAQRGQLSRGVSSIWAKSNCPVNLVTSGAALGGGGMVAFLQVIKGGKI